MSEYLQMLKEEESQVHSILDAIYIDTQRNEKFRQEHNDYWTKHKYCAEKIAETETNELYKVFHKEFFDLQDAIKKEQDRLMWGRIGVVTED